MARCATTPDDLGFQAERVAHANDPGNPRAEPDRHINGVDVGDGGEKLVRVSGNADDEIAMIRRREFIAALAGDLCRMVLRLVEVAAVFDEFGAETAHRRVLLGRIAMRYDDRGRQSGALRGESERLAVIAARRRDDAFDMRPFAFEPLHVEEASAQLESADRRVIFVLDEDLGADTRAQQRPRILRRRRHGGAYDRQSRFNIAEREHCSLSRRVRDFRPLGRQRLL